MTLIVEETSLMMTIQDWGRYGFRRFGIPESGPMDWFAFRSANALVGNRSVNACVEIGFSSAVLCVEGDALMAVTGAGYHLYVNDREMPLWMAFITHSGDRLRIEKVPGGNWCYLAVMGGIHSPMWLGSRSVFPRARLGRLLAYGDRLLLPPFANRSWLLAGISMPASVRPAYQHEPVIGVVPGPHQHRFKAESYQSFWNHPYTISPHSDRMGYRLSGPSLSHHDGADLVSQGMALGEIQVPADGQPIVMMPDHPTTGGYTSIGTVASVDMPLLAQAQPEESQLFFKPVEVSEAQKSLADSVHQLESALVSLEEPWLHL